MACGGGYILRKLALFAAIAAFGISSAPAFAPGGSMPDIGRQYFQRTNCHLAYDTLAETKAGQKPVSAEESAFATAYEAAATAGKPCPAPPAGLAARAINRKISTADGLQRIGQYISASDPAAHYEAGMIILAGTLPDFSADQGVQMVRRAAELGDPSAQMLMGSGYISGSFGAKDYKAALPLIEAAAAQGHVDAVFMAANFYKDGIANKADKKKALDYYRQAAERGHIYAAMLAFYMLQDGEGVPKDFKLAYRIARNLADQGETVGAVLTASALLQQRNAKDQEDEVLYWMDVAIRDGDATIRSEVSKFRPQVVAAFKRANAPPEYVPRVHKACPLKTVCLVDRHSGARQCTTNKDYWSDCDF